MLCLGKIFENPESNQAWEQRLGWIKSSQNDRSFDRIDGEPMEFEWNIFPGFNSLQLSEEVKRLLLRLDETPENFTGGSYSCRCSTTSPVDQETTKKNVWQMPNSYLCTREDLGKDNGHFIGPGSEKKWYFISEDRPQGVGQYRRKNVGGIRRKRMSNFPRYESTVQRSTQKQRTWKTVDTLCSRFGND